MNTDKLKYQTHTTRQYSTTDNFKFGKLKLYKNSMRTYDSEKTTCNVNMYTKQQHTKTAQQYHNKQSYYNLTGCKHEQLHS